MLTECFFYQSPVLFFFPLEFGLKRDVRTFIGEKKTDRKELGTGSGVSKGDLGRTKVQGGGEEAKAGMKEWKGEGRVEWKEEAMKGKMGRVDGGGTEAGREVKGERRCRRKWWRKWNNKRMAWKRGRKGWGNGKGRGMRLKEKEEREEKRKEIWSTEDVHKIHGEGRKLVSRERNPVSVQTNNSHKP